ncbi:MAG: 1-phosphofructokinase family hexose kinase [Propionibacteriaceae bacterium]|jgi:tagatose 6-phosphate kinase|nr:1-phosphofructokinase family hexose kinase [Propionibacteriaceae bacterium]
MAPRVITVTLNAAIDKRLKVELLRPGAVLRAASAEYSPGGKGLNVARVIAQLGGEVTATGFLGGHAGHYIADRLDAAHVPHQFVWAAGESRSCVNIIDAAGRATEILEPGLVITDADLLALTATIRSLSAPGVAVVFSGSLPQGCPPDTYAHLITAAKSAGALTVLDTSAEPLRHGLDACPDVIKPNAVEARALTGTTIEDPTSAARALRQLAIDRHIPVAICSLGARGAVLVCQSGLWWAEPPLTAAVNTVGCGDTLVAGFTFAAMAGLTPDQALVAAVELATAAARSATTGSFDPTDVEWVRQTGVQLYELAGQD